MREPTEPKVVFKTYILTLVGVAHWWLACKNNGSLDLTSNWRASGIWVNAPVLRTPACDPPCVVES